MNPDNLHFFFCYDRDLFDYLDKKGFRFITKAKHIRTNAVFTMFLQTTELDAALATWNKHKL